MKPTVQTYQFHKRTLEQLGNQVRGTNWPVVYILENSTHAYVGETTSAKKRIGDHLDNPKRGKFTRVHVIEHPQFNKSATLDTEARLIEYLSADEKLVLQNNNRGQRNHNYYNKDFYKALFREIWDELTKLKIVQNTLRNIENSDLFKYSPFKSLTDDQANVVDSLKKRIRALPESISFVNGEPGSGKTVLAVYLVKFLLSDTSQDQMRIGLVLPQTSLRETVKKIFRHVNGLKASMVLGPNDVANASGQYDLLIVDEAHRLSQRRNLANYSTFDEACRKLGLDPQEASQLDWIRQKSKHSVFFYDSRQTVRPSDVDKSVFEEVETLATKYTLSSQLRVLAGDKYSGYIDRVLRNQESSFGSFPGYDLRLFDQIDAMVSCIKTLDQEFGLSRVVAGFAWEWISREAPGKFDIQIQDLKLRWNATTKDWINTPNSPNEVGCIHTVQGYDLNYVGVIIGPELTYENGRIVFHKDRYKDRYGKHSSLTELEAMNYVVNIYKTLMTRGIRGTYIFACDDSLRDYLSRFIPSYSSQGEILVAEPRSDYLQPDEKN